VSTLISAYAGYELSDETMPGRLTLVYSNYKPLHHFRQPYARPNYEIVIIGSASCCHLTGSELACPAAAVMETGALIFLFLFSLC